MQEISMRKIDQIFQTDRRRAIKPDRSQHKARQPAFRRQKRQVWHMRDVRGLRPAEPYPDIAIKLDHRIPKLGVDHRSEEHTTELKSLMRTSYAVFCLPKTTNTLNIIDH